MPSLEFGVSPRYLYFNKSSDDDTHSSLRTTYLRMRTHQFLTLIPERNFSPEPCVMQRAIVLTQSLLFTPPWALLGCFFRFPQYRPMESYQGTIEWKHFQRVQAMSSDTEHSGVFSHLNTALSSEKSGEPSCIAVRSQDSEVWQTQIWILVVPFNNWVTLASSLNSLTMPQFPHVQNENILPIP